MPDTNISPPRESLYNYFKSLYAVILIRKVIEIHCLNIVETPNKQWGTYLYPLSLFPEQNSQSAHIWGWGGSEGDRAVRRPLRLHAGQCGKCAVYRNPLQGTAQPGAITQYALISCSVLCFCSFLYIRCVCLCFRLVTDMWWTPRYRKRPALWPVFWFQSHTEGRSHASGKWEEEVWTQKVSLRWQRLDNFFFKCSCSNYY